MPSKDDFTTHRLVCFTGNVRGHQEDGTVRKDVTVSVERFWFGHESPDRPR